jgi:hypothetical protein
MYRLCRVQGLSRTEQLTWGNTVLAYRMRFASQHPPITLDSMQQEFDSLVWHMPLQKQLEYMELCPCHLAVCWTCVRVCKSILCSCISLARAVTTGNMQNSTVGAATRTLTILAAFYVSLELLQEAGVLSRCHQHTLRHNCC